MFQFVFPQSFIEINVLCLGSMPGEVHCIHYDAEELFLNVQYWVWILERLLIIFFGAIYNYFDPQVLFLLIFSINLVDQIFYLFKKLATWRMKSLATFLFCSVLYCASVCWPCQFLSAALSPCVIISHEYSEERQASRQISKTDIKNDCIHVVFIGSWLRCMTRRGEEVGGRGDRATPFWVVVCTHWDEGIAAVICPFWVNICIQRIKISQFCEGID